VLSAAFRSQMHLSWETFKPVRREKKRKHSPVIRLRFGGE
jgi:hypothetical protein